MRNDGGTGAGSTYHFLISYEREDEAWARWIAWQIEDALVVDGDAARVFFDVWDVVPGDSTAGAIDRALRQAARVVLVLSPRSLSLGGELADGVWQAAWPGDEDDARPPVVPVRVSSFRPGGLLRGRRYVDLAGLDEVAAVTALLAGLGHAVRGGRAKSPDQPPFPGPSSAPRFPGADPVDLPGVAEPRGADRTVETAAPPGARGADPVAGADAVGGRGRGNGNDPPDPTPPILPLTAEGWPGGEPAGKRRRRAAWQAVALVAALVAVVSASTTVAMLAGDAETSSPVPNVALEPTRTPGQNPFMPSAGDDAEGVEPPDDVRGSLDADMRGLFGGTRDAASCDRAAMVAFLKAHPDLLAAWAAVLGIQPAELDAFVGGLTPVVLRADTAVTNHGFRDGRVTEFPAVLQAGTAVLVDRHGTPVVKCFCGNPLTPPQGHAQVRYTGQRWASFSEQAVTSVRAVPVTIGVFVLVDVRTGKVFQRPAGTDGVQDKPFTRTTEVDWENTNYITECDGSAGAMTVNVRGGTGAARRGDRTYNLDVVAVADGDLAGDGEPEAAVLLSCHPAPSNFFVTEIQVFRTGPERMAVLVPPEGDVPFTAPAYFGDTLAVRGDRLYTSGLYYAEGDSHASGPSVTKDISWHWDGRRFVPRIEETRTRPPATPSPQQTKTAPPSSFDVIPPSPTLPPAGSDSSAPDLRPTAITFDRSAPAVGEQVYFDSGIENVGAESTEVFNIKWLVNGAEVDAYGSHGGIPAGATVYDGNSQFIWSFTASGSYTITFIVDADNHAAESNENNNSRSVSIAVRP